MRIRITTAVATGAAIALVVDWTTTEPTVTPHSATAHTADGFATAPAEPSDVHRISLPLRFEPNHGQCDPEARFVHRGRGGLLFLTDTGSTTVLPRTAESGDVSAFRMRLAHANPDPRVEGESPLAGRSNYFIGNDPDAWVRDVPHVSRVRYHDVYPGVDLVYHGNGGGLEYDFVVRPGAEAGQIAMEFEGVDVLAIDDAGDLVIDVNGAEVRHLQPVVYQTTDDGRASVDGRFVLDGDRRVRFAVGDHDPDQPLVIDPQVVYATLLGGGDRDNANGVAADATGSAYVTGQTFSTDFPLAGAIDGTLTAGVDAYVVKLSAAGDAVVYSTFLGGSNETNIEWGNGVAVDDQGAVVVVGVTDALDFPTSNAAQAVFGGSTDGFAAKLDANGSALVYSTYIGGNGTDPAHNVALDALGAAYVTGQAGGDFPTTPSAVQMVSGGSNDGYLVKIPAVGGAYAYATLLGGSGDDGEGARVAVDGAGTAYVAMRASSTDLVTTPGAFQTTLLGSGSVWFVRVNAAGSAILTSTYFGGTGFELVAGIALDTAGNAWIGGVTDSTDLPTANAFQNVAPGSQLSGFFAKLSRDGTQLLIGSYIGGSVETELHSIASDPRGNVYLAGQTTDADFPLVDALQPLSGAALEAFLVKVLADGSAVDYATYFGGPGFEGVPSRAQPLAVDGEGTAYLVGVSRIAGFPVSPGAFQQTLSGTTDGFVVKISDELAGGPGVGDEELYASRGKFKINRARHAKGVAADSFLLKGVLNPRGMTSPDGGTLTLKLNGMDLVPPQTLDAKGHAGSGKGEVPKFRFRVNAKKGTYSLAVSKTDLRQIVTLPDVTEDGTTMLAIDLEITGAGLATPALVGDLDFAYGSRAGKTTRGSFAFTKNDSLGGAFMVTRATVSEQSGGGHKLVSRSAITPSGGGPIEITGGFTVTVGSAAPIVVPQSSLRTSGSGATSKYTYSRSLGAVTDLRRLAFSNRSRTLTITTTELSATGIPAAGPSAPTQADLDVRVEIETAAETLVFTSTLGLRRGNGSSRRWTR